MELHLRRFAISLLVAAFACGVISCVFLPTRIAMETMIRARLLVGVGVALPLAWVISEAVGPGGKWRWQVGAVAGVLLAFGISAAIVRTAWVADFVPQYTVAVPAADRAVLATLRSRSDPDQTVWQFAEAPWAAVPSGRDMWAPIFAGRPVANSLRATDYAQAAPYISRSDRFFAGEQVEIPAIMEWVYLSRALHPGSYDRVLSRLRADERWSQQACYAAACLFRRRRSVDP